MHLEEIVNRYISLGYNFIDAQSKVCQDIILTKLANSKFSKHITVKGGVVMHNISNDIRRATRDLDLDFIRYSLENDAIIEFINILNNTDDKIRIEIIGKIKSLHQQDYDGKRINIELFDESGYSLVTKIDLGVHKLFDIEQDEYCFDFNIIGKNINLLINSCEQIFAEKLKSLLKLGARSTRYKDLFDFYYLINDKKIDKAKLLIYIDILIIQDVTMRENNMGEIVARLKSIFYSTRYNRYLSDPKVNWLNISVQEAIVSVIDFLDGISVTV